MFTESGFIPGFFRPRPGGSTYPWTQQYQILKSRVHRQGSNLDVKIGKRVSLLVIVKTEQITGHSFKDSRERISARRGHRGKDTNMKLQLGKMPGSTQKSLGIYLAIKR